MIQLAIITTNSISKARILLCQLNVVIKINVYNYFSEVFGHIKLKTSAIKFVSSLFPNFF